MGHEDRSGFWNEVAFGNLFKRGFTNSREQPTQADYASVRGAFEQMVDKVRPKKIIVFSKRLWNYHIGEQSFEKIQSSEALLQDVYWYTKEKHRCLAMGTWHPSSIYGRAHKQEAKELIRAFSQLSIIGVHIGYNFDLDGSMMSK